jgi:hypothetical protein
MYTMGLEKQLSYFHLAVFSQEFLERFVDNPNTKWKFKKNPLQNNLGPLKSECSYRNDSNPLFLPIFTEIDNLMQ